MTSTTKSKIFTLVNLFLAISTIIVTYITVTQGTVAGQVDTGGSYGLFYFATFTVDSNILLGIIALATAIISFTKKPLPRATIPLYLMATTSALLTFLVVVTFLAPLRAIGGKNYFDMLMGPMFFFHFFNPVLAAVNLIFFAPSAVNSTAVSTAATTPQTTQKITKKPKLLALLPPIVYAIPYFICVALLHLWTDFYNFTFGGHLWATPLALLAICAIVYALAYLLAYFYNKRLKD